MSRAHGARAQMVPAFETGQGTPPERGFMRTPFASDVLGVEQPLPNREHLGYSRDPLPPIKAALTSDSDVLVPIDAHAFGFRE